MAKRQTTAGDPIPGEAAVTLSDPVETGDVMPAPVGDAVFTAPATDVPNSVYSTLANVRRPELVRVGGEREPINDSVDPEKEASIASQISEELAGGLADAVEVTKEAARQAAAYYAPLIARYTLMERSSDPNVSAKAARFKRHLYGQALGRAAELGLPLQQRQESRLLAAFDKGIAMAGQLV